MTVELKWVCKALFITVFVAALGVMVYRIWYWTDNCVFNRIYRYPPVYICGVHPFNFSDNYIDMRLHNQAMSEWVDSGAKLPRYSGNKSSLMTNGSGVTED